MRPNVRCEATGNRCMKVIEVRDQVSLPLRRCMELTIRGVRHRLFRSMVTVIIVVLAVAFLMMMLSTSFVDRQVSKDVHQRTSARRTLEEWVDKLSVPMTFGGLSSRLAGALPGSPAWEELKRWGQLSSEQMDQLVALAGQQQGYERYLAAVKPGERNALVGSREGEAVFAYLAEPGGLSEFLEAAKSVRMAFPTGQEALKTFVARFTEAKPLRDKILAGHAAAVGALRKELGATTVLEVLGGPPSRASELLRRHGFTFDPAVLEVLQEQAVLALDAEKLVALLHNKQMRGVIARHLGVEVPKLVPAHVFEIASGAKGAEWLRQQVDDVRRKAQEEISKAREKAMAKSGEERRQALNQVGEMEAAVIAPLEIPADRVFQVAREQVAMSRLAEIEASLPEDTGDRWLGFASRTTWLIIISFVVCVVGVANAMLMSVTERFREIATMKCLGALDSVIMIMFVMESSLQGLAGGVVGIVVGLILGVTRSLWGFGTLALVNLPGLILLVAAGVCLVAGVVLAAMAAVYPAWVAARLAPMEAMRIE